MNTFGCDVVASQINDSHAAITRQRARQNASAGYTQAFGRIVAQERALHGDALQLHTTVRQCKQSARSI